MDSKSGKNHQLINSTPLVLIVPPTNPFCTLRSLTGSKCSREFHSIENLFLDHLQVSIVLENGSYIVTLLDTRHLLFHKPKTNTCQIKKRYSLLRTWNALFEDRAPSSSICPVINLNRLGFSVPKRLWKSCNSSSDRLSRFCSAHSPMIMSSSSQPLCFAWYINRLRLCKIYQEHCM